MSTTKAIFALCFLSGSMAFGDNGCTADYSPGDTFFANSIDHYYDSGHTQFGNRTMFTTSLPATLYQDITSGPCHFTYGEITEAYWITGYYSDDSGHYSRTWTLEDPGMYYPDSWPDYWVTYPRALDAYGDNTSYPVLDYPIVSSTFVNENTLEASVINTYVTWQVDYALNY